MYNYVNITAKDIPQIIVAIARFNPASNLDNSIQCVLYKPPLDSYSSILLMLASRHKIRQIIYSDT